MRIGLIIGFILILFSCDKEPDCLWCTTVFVSPETGVVLGEGYACGETLEIVQERQYFRVDSISGDVRLTVTYCGDKASTKIFFSKPFVVCGEMIYLYDNQVTRIVKADSAENTLVSVTICDD